MEVGSACGDMLLGILSYARKMMALRRGKCLKDMWSLQVVDLSLKKVAMGSDV